MRKFIKIGAILVAVAMFFTGCGDPMVPLTEDEETIVVNYSAGTVAKHNSFQQEGMTTIYPEEEEEQEENEEPDEVQEPVEEEQKGDDKESQETEKQPEKETSAEEAGQLTLTEALAVPDVEFSYRDYSTVDSYKEGEYFSMDASEGNVLMMLNVNMTNTGNKAVECNLLTKQITFTLSLNEGAGIQNQTTMLTNDLSTYAGTLDPGQTEAVILMFDVPQQTAENITSMQLSMQSNGKTNEILLK